jgi:hypothetical protein
MALTTKKIHAETVTQRPCPGATTRVSAQVTLCGICGGHSGTGAGVLRILRFPLPLFIPLTAANLSSGAGTVGQIVADIPSGLSLTPPLEKKIHTDRNSHSGHQYAHL